MVCVGLFLTAEISKAEHDSLFGFRLHLLHLFPQALILLSRGGELALIELQGLSKEGTEDIFPSQQSIL